MLKDFNESLARVIDQQRKRNKLRAKKREMEVSLQELTAKLNALEQRLYYEKKDVEKLEGLSLTALFYQVLGSKEAQLEKERQEYLAAKLRYDECKQEVEQLKHDLQQINQELKEYAHVDQEYERLLKEKEDLLMRSQGEASQRLIKLSEEGTEAQADLREVEEAIDAGEKVLGVLHEMLDALSSAQGWGTWDMLGGGFFSTHMKHERINESKHYAQEVQYYLRAFQRELADVDRGLLRDVHLEVGGFLGFADYFFDSLIVDWVVQSKINHSLRKAEELYQQVEGVLYSLSRTREGLKQKIERLAKERKTLLETIEAEY